MPYVLGVDPARLTGSPRRPPVGATAPSRQTPAAPSSAPAA